MKRKICAIFLSLIMVITVFTQMAFAGIVEDMKNGPNTIAMITISNPSCVEIENVKGLEVKLSKPSAGINISIPVENLEIEGELMNIWLGQGKERVTDAVMKQLADIQGKIDLGGYEDTPEDMIGDIGDVLEGFDVDIVGLPPDHYTYGASAVVLTNDIFKQIVELVKEMLGEEFGEFTSFKDLIEALMKEADLTLDDLNDLDPGLKAIVEELINTIDPLLAYLTSEEFTGMLVFGADLVCACPEIWGYQIQHRYYERIDGKLKLVGTVHLGEYDKEEEEYYLIGEAGQYIRAKDYVNCDYKGKTYDYMGSYDMWALYDNDWKSYKMSSFRLGEDMTGGLVLRYVIDKGTTVVPGEKSPDTGDHSLMGMYIALLVTAVLAAGAVAAYNRK